MAPLVYSETFDATGARTSSTVKVADGTASNLGFVANGFGQGVSLAYDAATGGYTVKDASGSSATFLPSMINLTLSNEHVTTFTKAAGNTDDQLTLFNAGADNTPLQLSYVSYGAWQRGVKADNGATIDFSQQYFVYGIRQAANQPSTGFASYTTAVDGIWSAQSGLYKLAGDSTFTANFGNMTVSTTLNLLAQNVTAPTNDLDPHTYLGRFAGSGTIAAMGGGFSGTLTHQGTDSFGNTLNGSFAGAFFGPHGEEMGYTFSLRAAAGSTGTAAGAVVGKHQ